MDVSPSATQLGINRSTSQSVDIEGKISLGRKTAYSLMGAGFHWGGGVKSCHGMDMSGQPLSYLGCYIA